MSVYCVNSLSALFDWKCSLWDCSCLCYPESNYGRTLAILQCIYERYSVCSS
jgi:hypothetical protein